MELKSRRLFPIAWNGSDSRAAKEQTLFIRKYGKEKLLHVHDKLNEVYDFNKSAGVIGNGC